MTTISRTGLSLSAALVALSVAFAPAAFAMDKEKDGMAKDGMAKDGMKK